MRRFAVCVLAVATANLLSGWFDTRIAHQLAHFAAGVIVGAVIWSSPTSVVSGDHQ